MSKKRMFSRMLAAVFAVVSILQVGAVSSDAAGNYQDSVFSFDFDGEQKYTTFREKRDDTSSYMKCESCTSGRSYTAHVVGLKTGIQDVSNGHVYLFTAGTTYKMINYAYENGCTYAGIAAVPNYVYNFSASGLWSPDSV